MGAYFAAGVTLALILVMLIVMERVEARFFPNKNIKTLYLVFEEKYFNYDVLVHELRELKIAVVNMDVARTISSERIKLSLQVHVPQKIDIEALTETLKRIGTLVRLELTTNEKPTR
jgi:uncharacterized membrane protein YhiD involved in acid resistance